MAIMTEEERNKCLAAIDIAINQMEADDNEIAILKSQLAEVQSYKDDAERYRWLRDNGCIFWTDVFTNKEVKHLVSEQAMDEAIDKAMK